MSKHAEFEASIRDLPPVVLEKLNQAKIEKLREIKKENELNQSKLGYENKKFDTHKFLISQKDKEEFKLKDAKEFEFGVFSALCALDASLKNECKNSSVNAFNNLCLAEALSNGKEPRFVCDDQWVEDIGADSTAISKFYDDYDSWKSILLKYVKLLMKNQTALKLKQHVIVPLSYRQDNFEGDSVDKVCFEANNWKKWFGKLQASTKISEQTLWILALIFYADKNIEPIIPKDNKGKENLQGLTEICKFVARSLEVRTDEALSFLKICATIPYATLAHASGEFEFGADVSKNMATLGVYLMHGIQTGISQLLDKKPNLDFDKNVFELGFFQAMQDDNQALFDFLLKTQILSGEKDMDAFLKAVAMNSVKFKNNEAYFFKLLAVSKQKFSDFITDIKEREEYSDVLKSMERRLVLRNPFLNKLSVGEKKDRMDFLLKVKRSNSKSFGA